MSSVYEFMTANPLTVPANTSVTDLADLMQKTAVPHVPVLADGKVMGVVSHDDVRLALSPAGKKAQQTKGETDLPSLASLMTATLLTVKPTDSIYKVVELMSLFLPRVLLVEANNQLVGLVSVRNLLDYLGGTEAL